MSDVDMKYRLGIEIDVSQPTDVAFRKEGKVGATTKKKKKKNEM